MTALKKYKNLYKFELSLIKKLPLRILKFKRSKWKQFQQQNFFQIKFTAKNNYYNLLKLKMFYKQWSKLNLYYKEGLFLKNLYQIYYESSLLKYYIKNSLLKQKKFSLKNFFLNCFIKPFFKIDIFIRRIYFFESILQARQAILAGMVKVNGFVVSPNYILKRGDFLTITLQPINYAKIIMSDIVYTFSEIDYYCGNIIILKNFCDLNEMDFNYFIKTSFNVKKFLDYIYK